MPGKVRVKIIAGRNLPVMDRSSDTTDAYVEIKFGNITYKTDVYRKSLNPQWNSDFYRFEVDDSELQDEPLQIRLMDHDTYSANDAIGKVNISLNPLLLPILDASGQKIYSGKGSVMSGWIPVFDTMHGIRGEVNLIVKVDLFSDVNKFRQSSCGVQFFHSPNIPYGYHAQVIHGFVEELVVNDDPEYQWIDKIRTPRASNEARQVVFLKLSSQVQRKIGLKAIDLGANAVIGYTQCFDLEGDVGVVARGIGTAVTLVKITELQKNQSTVDPISLEEQKYLNFMSIGTKTSIETSKFDVDSLTTNPGDIVYKIMGIDQNEVNPGSNIVLNYKLNNYNNKYDICTGHHHQNRKNKNTHHHHHHQHKLRADAEHKSVNNCNNLKSLFEQEDLRGENSKGRLKRKIKHLSNSSKNLLNRRVIGFKSKLDSQENITMSTNKVSNRIDNDGTNFTESCTNLLQSYRTPITDIFIKTKRLTNKPKFQRSSSDGVGMAALLVRSLMTAPSLDSIEETHDTLSKASPAKIHKVSSVSVLPSKRGAFANICKTDFKISDSNVSTSSSISTSETVSLSSVDSEVTQNDILLVDADTVSMVVKSILAHDESEINRVDWIKPKLSINESKNKDNSSNVDCDDESSDDDDDDDDNNNDDENENDDDDDDNDDEYGDENDDNDDDDNDNNNGNQCDNDNDTNMIDNNKNKLDFSKIPTIMRCGSTRISNDKDGNCQDSKLIDKQTKPEELEKLFSTDETDKESENWIQPGSTTDEPEYIENRRNSIFHDLLENISEKIHHIQERIQFPHSNSDGSHHQTHHGGIFDTAMETMLMEQANIVGGQIVQPVNDQQRRSSCDNLKNVEKRRSSIDLIKKHLNFSFRKHSHPIDEQMKNNKSGLIDSAIKTMLIDRANICEELLLHSVSDDQKSGDEPIYKKKEDLIKSINYESDKNKLEITSETNDLLKQDHEIIFNTDKTYKIHSDCKTINNNYNNINDNLFVKTCVSNNEPCQTNSILEKAQSKNIGQLTFANNPNITEPLLNHLDDEFVASFCVLNTDTNKAPLLAPVPLLPHTRSDATASPGKTIGHIRAESTGGGKLSQSPVRSILPLGMPTTVPTTTTTTSGLTTNVTFSSNTEVICRRLSDSDLNIPKGCSLNTPAATAVAVAATRLPGLATLKNSLNQDNLDMLEYPFLTMTKYPRGFIIHIGATVCARSVKLLERVPNPDEPETRDSWWTELRMEIRSHARALGCNVILGYSEVTSISDDVCVLSVTGTAAVINLQINPGEIVLVDESTTAKLQSLNNSLVKEEKIINGAVYIDANEKEGCNMPKENHLSMDVTGENSNVKMDENNATKNEQKTSIYYNKENNLNLINGKCNISSVPPTVQSALPTVTTSASIPVSTTTSNLCMQLKEKLSCSICHIPYNKSTAPFNVIMKRCNICKKGNVPNVLLVTIEIPETLQITGRGCFLQAQVCRMKKDLKAESNAKEISDGLPFLEYDLHRLLINKLRTKGMNAIFGLKSTLAIGEKMMALIATGTAVFLSALPKPSVPKIIAGNLWSNNVDKLNELQKSLEETVDRNREMYHLKSVEEYDMSGKSAEIQSDTDDSDDELGEIDLTLGNKDTCVLEIDDIDDLEIISLLMEPCPPDGFLVVNTQTIPGLHEFEIMRNLQMFTQIWRAKIPLNQQCNNFPAHFQRLLQTIYFKLRTMIPCAICDLKFRLDLPESEEVQILITGMALGLGDPSKISKYKSKIAQHIQSREHRKIGEDELIFNLEEVFPESVSHTQSLSFPGSASSTGIFNQTGSLKLRNRSPVKTKYNSIRHANHLPIRERYGVDITLLSYIPGGKIEKYLGNLNFFFIRESTSIRENGGISGFVHSFITELLAIVRAHVTALGGNAMVSFYMTELILVDNPHKNQGQCLISVGGDAVFVSYFLAD